MHGKIQVEPSIPGRQQNFILHGCVHTGKLRVKFDRCSHYHSRKTPQGVRHIDNRHSAMKNNAHHPPVVCCFSLGWVELLDASDNACCLWLLVYMDIRLVPSAQKRAKIVDAPTDYLMPVANLISGTHLFPYTRS